MSDAAAAIAAAATVAIVVLLAVLAISGHGTVEELKWPEPECHVEVPAPPEPVAEPLDGGEWLPLSPAQRDAEIVELEVLLAVSPDADVQTDLPADPAEREHP